MAKKSKEVFETDPQRFSTNKELLQALGLLWSKTDWNPLRSIFSLSLITSGMFHYSLRVAFTYTSMELLTIIKILHLTNVYFLAGLCAYVVFLQSRRFHIIHSIIKDGFYNYPEGLTQEQMMIRSKANHKVSKITKYGLRFFVISTLGSCLKEPVPYDFEEWTKEYNGWIPFVVDSWPKYFASQFYHLLAALSAALLGGSVCIVFIAVAEHLLAQLEILSISFRNAIGCIPTRGDKVAEKLAYQRMKYCLQHHNVILRFFDEFQKYYSIPLFCMLAGTTVAMCTIAFVVTDPSSTFGVSAAFLSLMAPEVAFCICYCTYGQKITDMGDVLRETVYNAPWYYQPRPVKMAMLMVLIKTRKPLTLSAAGLKDCSIKSIGEITQTTYTYFNALQIFRGNPTSNK
uniref:Odorant receptor n=1 Tax=Adelphocoris lineolatus TaxID=236346 RepID=A0A2I4PHJ0_ADELI|nr:olfactory receptor 14 [Adelphocoris lineolatus]